MKKTILLAAAVILLLSCTKQEGPGFNYDINLVLGRWRVTAFEQDGAELSIEGWPSILGATRAVFSSNGSFFGSGMFGSGIGTYTAAGNTIITYMDGAELYRYDVISLTGDLCRFKVYKKGSPDFIILIYRRE